MSPEPEREPEVEHVEWDAPDFWAIAHLRSTTEAPDRLVHSVLAEAENGLPSREIIEAACLALSNSNDLPAILRHAYVIAILLRTDQLSASPVTAAVEGWERHSVDPDRWQLAKILASLELPFDDLEIIDHGALHAICEALFIEIGRSSESTEPLAHETVDGNLLVEQIQKIIALGRPYEQDMLEALKQSFWRLVIAPEPGGQEVGEFAAFMMQELGSNVALYLEDALVDSFSVSFPEAFDPILSGQLGGSVLYYFHSSQDVPRYARESILRRLAEKLDSIDNQGAQLRILSALASYATADPSQIETCLSTLALFHKNPHAPNAPLILQALSSTELYHTQLATELISSPFIVSTCRACADLDQDARDHLENILTICGLSINRSNPTATRAFINNFVQFALVEGDHLVNEAPLPEVLTALAAQDPDDFCSSLLEFLKNSKPFDGVAPLCANIIVTIFQHGTDWLPSEAISALQSQINKLLDVSNESDNRSLEAARAALKELSDYGL